MAPPHPKEKANGRQYKTRDNSLILINHFDIEKMTTAY